jgi:hypothetical protein
MPLERVVSVPEIRGEPVVTGQPNVIRGGNHHVGDHPTLEAAIRSASTRAGPRRSRVAFRRSTPGWWTRADRWRNARSAGGRMPASRRTKQLRCGLGPIDRQILAGCPHRRTPPMILTVPQHFRISDQAAKVAIKTRIASGAGSRQQPFSRDPALRFLHAFGDQLSHRVVIVVPLDPRWRHIAGLVGFELLHDPFDGLMGGAATARRRLGGTRVVDSQK